MTTSLADPQSFQNSLDRDQQALQRAGLRPCLLSLTRHPCIW
jgi:cob(I)alamin adenosyltransferase